MAGGAQEIRCRLALCRDSADPLRQECRSFDKQAIAETKRLVDIASLPTDAEIVPEWDAFIASVGRPASQTRLKAFMERGFHRAGDVENRPGYYLSQLGANQNVYLHRPHLREGQAGLT
jgi:hypothetical protein